MTTVRREMPGAGPHGGDGAAVAAALGIAFDEVLDLSMSLNPVAPDPVPVLRRHVEAVRRYPDAAAATRLLAEHIGVAPERVLLTSGGAEAIGLLAAELGGSVEEPEFSLHPRGDGPRWRSNPHNPTGLLADTAETAAVWDEAFFPLATGRWTRGDAGVAVVGSLTKLFACPGLRLGYLIAEPELLERCRRRQPAWSVSSLALAALPDFLENADLLAWARAIAELRAQLSDELGAHGLRTRPSDANWLLVEHATLRSVLAPQGIVVRDCASFGLPDVTRIAVPSADGLARLSEALGTVDLNLSQNNLEDVP